MPYDEMSDKDEQKYDTLMTELEQLQAEGNYIDVYLLPTTYESGVKDLYFSDMEQAMRNGRFADIGDYYDMDDSIGKESLNTAVMDAGVVNGFRYALPLRYDFPVAYVATDKMAILGLSPQMFQSGITGMWNDVSQTGSREIAGYTYSNLKCTALNFFPELMDYDQQEVLLSAADLADFFDSYARHANARDYEMPLLLNELALCGQSFMDGSHWLKSTQCMVVGNLEDALGQAAFAKALNTKLDMYPLTSSDGRLTAEVTFYGAVDAQCPHPALAYQFLREFLREDLQWLFNNTYWGFDTAPTGFPVRTVDSAARMYQENYSALAGKSERFSGLHLGFHTDAEFLLLLSEILVTDTDIPILQAQIDVARFPLPDLEKQLWQTVQTAGEPSADTYAIAQEFVEHLEGYLLDNYSS